MKKPSRSITPEDEQTITEILGLFTALGWDVAIVDAGEDGYGSLVAGRAADVERICDLLPEEMNWVISESPEMH